MFKQSPHIKPACVGCFTLRCVNKSALFVSMAGQNEQTKEGCKVGGSWQSFDCLSSAGSVLSLRSVIFTRFGIFFFFSGGGGCSGGCADASCAMSMPWVSKTCAAKSEGKVK